VGIFLSWRYCFDTVCWLTGRASCLQETARVISEGSQNMEEENE